MRDGLWWRCDADPGVVLSREQVRRLDRLAMERLGMSGMVLMENASTAVAAGVMRLLEGREEGGVVVVCGGGNNGGDGLGCARKLHVRGVRGVRVVLLKDVAEMAGDAGVFARMCAGVGVAMEVLDAGDVAGSLERAGGEVGASGGVIVDAMFGTGLDRALRPPLDAVVGWMEERRGAGARVLSVDVPSGMDADTGEALGGVAVRADATVTLAAMKRGMLTEAGQARCGAVWVGDIGVSRGLVEEVGG